MTYPIIFGVENSEFRISDIKTVKMPYVSEFTIYLDFCPRSRGSDHVDLDNERDQNQYQQGVKIKMSANPVNHLTVTHQKHNSNKTTVT